MKVEINDRDLLLFLYLQSCKIATTRQINRDFFKRSLVTTRQRLAKLRDNDLIEVVGKGLDSSRPHAYSLSNNGFEILKKYCPDKFFIQRFKSNSPVHDLMLVDLRHVFSSKKMVARFWMENEIQTHAKFVEDFDLSTFRRLQVDGLVKLVNEKKDVMFSPIEFESTAKSQKRYEDKLKKFYEVDAIETVLFISQNVQIQDLVKKVEREKFPGISKKFYYALYDEIKFDSEKIIFRNQESFKLEIR
jgi:hypothetical protein